MSSNRYRLEAILKPLVTAGIDLSDAKELRRISMTLHRWHELECGDSNNNASWSIVRGHKTREVLAGGSVVLGFEYDDDGKPYREVHYHRGEAKASYYLIADYERGARKRLAKIMARYPGFTAYVQGDPRGAALYILRPGDVPQGADVSSCYNRGIAVYK